MIISYAQNFEDVMLWRALGHVEKGFYIDIGAQHPIIDSVSKAFYEKGWRGINVEANLSYATLLMQDRPDEKVIQAAVNDKRGAMTFYEIPETGLSTGKSEIAQGHKEKGFEVREITVPCITLANIFKQAGKKDIHWLKIDVEGMELQVLRSWGSSKARPWIVVVESTLPMTQTETHEQWKNLILKKGYKPVFFDGLNRYYLSSRQPQLAEAFKAGPNVFDDFQLNGTACAPFCALVNERHRQKELDLSMQLQAEQQKRLTVELEREQREKVLSEQISQAYKVLDNVLCSLKQRELDLVQELQVEQQMHHAIEREREQREKALNEQITQTRSESESHLLAMERLRVLLNACSGVADSSILEADCSKKEVMPLEHVAMLPKPVALGEHVAIDFTQTSASAYLAEGFYAVEHWGVWSSGKSSKMIIPVDLVGASEVELAMTLRVKMFEGILAHAPVLQIMADGKHVGYALFRELQAKLEISFSHRIAKSPCLIEFSLSHTGSPATILQSADQRELGFGLYSFDISVSPITKGSAGEGGDARNNKFWGLLGEESFSEAG